MGRKRVCDWGFVFVLKEEMESVKQIFRAEHSKARRVLGTFTEL